MFKFADRYTVMLIGNCPKTTAGICFRGNKLVVLAMIASLIVAANLLSWGSVAYFRYIEHKLAKAENSLREQDNLIVSAVSKLKAIRAGLKHVSSFDTKLGYIIKTPFGDRTAETDKGSIAPSAEDMNLSLYRRDLAVRRLNPVISSLTGDVRREEVMQQYLLFGARENLDRLDRMPSIWPAEGEVQSQFGYRRDPFNGRPAFHGALDIGAPVGTRVICAAKGIVAFVGNEGNGLGINVIINHGYGIKTVYAHLHRAFVREGQTVSRGELIAEVGMTGRTTGPHLHYVVEVNGLPVNPASYILN